MKIGIIDYGVGNLSSVQKAFRHIGADTEVTGNITKIKNCDKLILPGVGAFKDAMVALNKTGLSEVIKTEAKNGKYIMGICLGMQLLFDRSDENGRVDGLGLFPGEIVRFSSDMGLKIPHMGWNDVIVKKKEPIFTDNNLLQYVYFVHSYYARTNADIVSATAVYGDEITVGVQRDNLFGLQFHPEKSGEYGINLLRNFGGLK